MAGQVADEVAEDDEDDAEGEEGADGENEMQEKELEAADLAYVIASCNMNLFFPGARTPTNASGVES